MGKKVGKMGLFSGSLDISMKLLGLNGKGREEGDRPSPQCLTVTHPQSPYYASRTRSGFLPVFLEDRGQV